MAKTYPLGRIFQRRGRWFAYYYVCARERHKEEAKTRDEAEALLSRRLKQIRSGKFLPSLVTDRRNAQISHRFTRERRDAQSARMKLKNKDAAFRVKWREGIDKANRPESIEKRKTTLKVTLSRPGVRWRRLKQLRAIARSVEANASRSSFMRSFHDGTALSGDQVLSLLKAAKRGKDRDWIMLLLTFWHRLKPHQTVELVAEDLAGGSVRIEGRGTEPLISHSELLLDERRGIEGWLGSAGLSGRLFPGSHKHFIRLIHQYASEAGLPADLSHPHVLRNSLEARERFRAELLSAAATADTSPETKRKPRERPPYEQTNAYRIARLVEQRLGEMHADRSQKRALVAARQAVVSAEAQVGRKIDFDSVAEYHRDYVKREL